MVLAVGDIATFGSFVALVLAIVIAYASSKIAQSKGRGPTLWAILGIIFSVLALIVIALLPRKH